jgi:uncharacterized protein YjgD (DUF1641 family)
MEVGLVALGLGALGYHFTDPEKNENYGPVIENNQYSKSTVPTKTPILNTKNASNGDNIYSQSQYDIVNKYVQQKADQSFQKSLDPINTNIIPPHFNDLPPEDKFKNMEDILKSQAENIYNNTVNSQEQNRMPGVSRNLYQKNNEYFNNTPGKDFTHNNMVPFFGGSIKQNTNDFITKTKLENFTGQFENNRAQKKELENMFKPEKNVSNVNGMRNSTEERLERMNPSIYKQNEKPFQEVKVGPGLNIGSDAVNSGEGFHSFYRPELKTVDELRTSNNPKISYEGRTVDGISKSSIKRAPNPNVKKYNPDTFFIDMNLDRALVTVGDQVKETYRSEQIIPDTNRAETSTEYIGVAGYNNSQIRESCDEPKHKQSFKVEQCNLNMGVVKSINDFISTGVGTSSFNLPENQRDTTAINNHLHGPKGNMGSDYVIDPNDIAKTTIKQTTIEESRSGFLNSNIGNVVKDPHDIAKATIKETTSEESRSGFLNSNIGNVVKDPNDIAKKTIKETTSEEIREGFISTKRKNTVYDPNDIAKTTIKETISEENRSGFLDSNTRSTVYDPNDLFKTTQKETLVEETRTGHMDGNSKLTVYDPNDLFKTTQKETLIEETRTGHMDVNSKVTTYDPNDLPKITNKETLVEEVRTGHLDSNTKLPAYDPNDLFKTTNKETLVEETRTGHVNVNSKVTTYDPNDVAKTTNKETLVEETRTGHMDSNTKLPVYDPNDLFKTTNKETLVEETRTGHMDANTKLPAYDPNDITKRTIKETTIEEVRSGQLNGNGKGTTYDPNDLAKRTTKETTVEEVRSGYLNGNDKGATYDPDDIARRTIKETTVEDSRAGHINTMEKQFTYDPNDVAKTTVKETTVEESRAGHINTTDKGIVYDPDDVAKTTIKETVVEDTRQGHFGSGPNHKITVYDPNDVARTTQKEQLSDFEYHGNPGENIMHTSYENIYNARVPDRKEKVSVGRAPTQQGPKNGISGDNINLKLKKLNNYYKNRNLISNRNVNNNFRAKINETRCAKNLRNDDRLDVALLDAFNENPYTQPLDSYY